MNQYFTLFTLTLTSFVMEILKEFGIQPTLLLAQIVNFLIILFVLKKFFYKPIIKVLDARKKRIEVSLKNADLIEEKLAKTEEKSKLIMQDAQTNAKNLIDDAKKEAEYVVEKSMLDARQAAEKILSDTKIQIEAQRLAMQKRLEAETLDLVVLVVKKVIGRNLKPKEKQELTSSAEREITKQIQ